ncbi:MAG: SIS domain-containing protein [Candidatus Omnitrophota bacterium]
MKDKIKEIIKDSITAKAYLLYDEELIKKIQESAKLISMSLNKGKKILIFGNGGSAADSQHFAAELIGRFQKERRALAAVSLSTDTSVLTSLSNDYSFDVIFKRQIEALGNTGDIAFGISTSGTSKNVLEGIKAARKLKIKTIGLSGDKKNGLNSLADIGITVPNTKTARIQEAHILIIHIICELIENSLKK